MDPVERHCFTEEESPVMSLLDRAPRRRSTLALVTAVGLLAGLLPITSVAAFTADPATVWINEIHYDNAGADTGEAVEVAGPAGTDLGGESIVLYNGSGGLVYGTVALGGMVPAQQGGFGTAVLTYSSRHSERGARRHRAGRCGGPLSSSSAMRAGSPPSEARPTRVARRHRGLGERQWPGR